MKTTTLAIAAAMAAGGAAHAQEAVQWRVEDGGNGHWYDLTRHGTTVCWHDARQWSIAAGGHLATLTSLDEHQFVVALVAANNPGAAENGPYLGATCEDAPWGQWSWVTGEEFSFTAWNPGEPNNGGVGDERYVHLWNWTLLGWNDTSACDSPTYSFVIEWSADCNGDGIVDYGQILDGTFADINANGVPDTCECFADVNQDGVVNGADISAVLGFWGQAGKPLPAADITRDGLVDGADIAVLLGSWGPCQ